MNSKKYKVFRVDRDTLSNFGVIEKYKDSEMLTIDETRLAIKNATLKDFQYLIYDTEKKEIVEVKRPHEIP